MKAQENFLDKNTLISIVLIFIAWFSWDSYMKKKYPVKNKGQAEVSQKIKQENKQPLNIIKSKKTVKKDFLLKQNHSLKEKLFFYKGKNLSFNISSKGMGFKNITLSSVLNRKGQVISLFSGENYIPFETRLIGVGAKNQVLDFSIKKTSDNSWVGQAHWNNIKIIKTLLINPTEFVVTAKIKLTGNLNNTTGIYTLINHIQNTKQPEKNFLSFFTPPDIFSFFISTSKEDEQIPIVKGDIAQTQELESKPAFSSVQVAALGTKYFGQALVEESSDVLPQFNIRFLDKHYIGFVKHSILNFQKDFNISYKMFMGPKDFSLLTKKYPSLISWVDFGWFGVLSRFILQILQFFYSLVGNWGVSIILLTCLVRVVLLPFVISSHRSMEVMKKIHPEIQKIRAKFKSNPQKMNQEVMAIMKTHRANPLGGCLPLLLQIPVFWSLWRALSNSYSLYQAPFIFWIQDLSWKDPYYILPVLMGFFMFVQQKISPVTMSKEMTRAMQIMPVFMSVFMVNLPSGLVLYMLVSSLFGLAQQIYLNKQGAHNTNLITTIIPKKKEI